MLHGNDRLQKKLDAQAKMEANFQTMSPENQVEAIFSVLEELGVNRKQNTELFNFVKTPNLALLPIYQGLLVFRVYQHEFKKEPTSAKLCGHVMQSKDPVSLALGLIDVFQAGLGTSLNFERFTSLVPGTRAFRDVRHILRLFIRNSLTMAITSNDFEALIKYANYGKYGRVIYDHLKQGIKDTFVEINLDRFMQEDHENPNRLSTFKTSLKNAIDSLISQGEAIEEYKPQPEREKDWDLLSDSEDSEDSEDSNDHSDPEDNLAKLKENMDMLQTGWVGVAKEESELKKPVVPPQSPLARLSVVSSKTTSNDNATTNNSVESSNVVTLSTSKSPR